MSFYVASKGLGTRVIASKYGPIKVDQRYDVPLAAGLSKDRKTLYVDRRISLTRAIQGKAVDRTPFLLVHEMEEAKREQSGWPYLRAHVRAEKLENEAVKRAGVDPAAYEASWRPDIALAAKTKNPQLPPDIIKKPYEHPHQARARQASQKA